MGDSHPSNPLGRLLDPPAQHTRPKPSIVYLCPLPPRWLLTKGLKLQSRPVPTARRVRSERLGLFEEAAVVLVLVLVLWGCGGCGFTGYG